MAGMLCASVGPLHWRIILGTGMYGKALGEVQASTLRYVVHVECPGHACKGLRGVSLQS